MEKYILELINENNRVIIPNFGAFIISKENGISILFNNFLSFNDGLLVNYVAEKKGIDTIIATDQVFDYVDTLKKELDETGTYSIKELGVFKKDDNGILRFQQAENFGEHFDEKETKDQEEIKDKEQKSDVLLDIDDDMPLEPEEEQPDDDIKEEELMPENQSDSILTIDTDAENIVPTQTIVEDSVVKKEVEPEIKKEVVKDSNPNESKQVNKTDTSRYAEKIIREKKRRDIITFLVIAGIVIIGLGIYLIFFSNFNEKKEKKPAKVTEKPIVDKPVKDTAAIVLEEAEPEPEPEPVIEPVVNKKGLIHLIVGGFIEENNAIKMVERLRKSGYEKSQIVNKGAMYLVSIDSDFSYQKMEDIQQQVLEKEQLESWMYQIK